MGLSDLPSVTPEPLKCKFGHPIILICEANDPKTRDISLLVGIQAQISFIGVRCHIYQTMYWYVITLDLICISGTSRGQSIEKFYGLVHLYLPFSFFLNILDLFLVEYCNNLSPHLVSLINRFHHYIVPCYKIIKNEGLIFQLLM